MATQTTIILSDSLDERIKTDVETVTFFHPMTGQKMEIELGEANRKHFGNHLSRLDKYFEAAVVVEAAVVSKPKPGKNTETTKIREWARENGFTIGDRGRISAEILTAYAAAQEVIETAPVVEVESTETAEIVEDEPSTEDLQTVAAADLTDDDILAMMAEIESSTGAPVELEDLAKRVDTETGSE